MTFIDEIALSTCRRDARDDSMQASALDFMMRPDAYHRSYGKHYFMLLYALAFAWIESSEFNCKHLKHFYCLWDCAGLDLGQ